MYGWMNEWMIEKVIINNISRFQRLLLFFLFFCSHFLLFVCVFSSDFRFRISDFRWVDWQIGRLADCRGEARHDMT